MSTLASPATATATATALFGRVEASIFGESALIDRETGRVYWECGNSNTLYESSVTPQLDRFGVEHAQATVLTMLIALAFLSVLSGWLKRIIDSCYYGTLTYTARNTNTATTLPYLSSSWAAKTLSVAVVLAKCTILKLPHIPIDTNNHRWVVLSAVVVILYFFESYHCSTRWFLANLVSNATDLDAYIDGLKQEPPVVTWKVQTFHYELRRMFAVPRMLRLFFHRCLKPSTSATTTIATTIATSTTTSTSTSATTETLELPRKSSRHTKPMFLITRKVVTNEASEFYHYGSHSDKTIVGIWSRALPPLGSDDKDAGGQPTMPQFRKISLSKVLVLSDKRSREDYFRQQSEFVTRYGREDEFAEFSTSIDVAGYRPRLLVAWPLLSSLHNSDTNYKHKHEHKPYKAQHYHHRLVRLSAFWAFTCLGMTVPYRIWFKRHCDMLRVTVVKETNVKANANATPKTAFDNNYSYLRSWFPTQHRR